MRNLIYLKKFNESKDLKETKKIRIGYIKDDTGSVSWLENGKFKTFDDKEEAKEFIKELKEKKYGAVKLFSEKDYNLIINARKSGDKKLPA